MVFCCFGEDIFDQKQMIFIDQVLFYLVIYAFVHKSLTNFKIMVSDKQDLRVPSYTQLLFYSNKLFVAWQERL